MLMTVLQKDFILYNIRILYMLCIIMSTVYTVVYTMLICMMMMGNNSKMVNTKLLPLNPYIHILYILYTIHS